MAEPFNPYHTWLGIPPEEQPPTYYRLLGIRLFEADAQVIEHAADQRMAYLRMMQTGAYSHWSQRLLNEVASARICLLDPNKKKAYDQRIQSWRARPATSAPPVKATPAVLHPSWTPEAAREPPIAVQHRRRTRRSSLTGTILALALAALILVGGVAAIKLVPRPEHEPAVALDGARISRPEKATVDRKRQVIPPNDKPSQEDILPPLPRTPSPKPAISPRPPSDVPPPSDEDIPTNILDQEVNQDGEDLSRRSLLPSTGSETFEIQLDSGESITKKDFRIDFVAAEEALRSPTTLLMKIGMDRMALVGQAPYRLGIPHGPVLCSYQDQSPSVYAEYDEGRRHGIHACWNEQGERVLWCMHYKKGRIDGCCCYFERDALRLVVEYRHDEETLVHLVSDDGVHTFSKAETAMNDREAGPVYTAFKKIQEEIDDNEREFKKGVHEIMNQIKREWLKDLSRQKRRNMIERGQKRRDEQNNMIRSFINRATSPSKMPTIRIRRR